LNCVGNGRILREGPFKKIWIQPAAGDAGGALGAALFTWYQYQDNPRQTNGHKDLQKASYLGPEFSSSQIKTFLDERQFSYTEVPDSEIADKAAELIEGQKVVGWFQGRMEFGPRALGNRSIVGDAQSSEMQRVINLKIKYRESFRPFAPSVLLDRVSDYFEIDRESPYMLLVAPVRKEIRREMTSNEQAMFGIDKLNTIRSEIPAITHVDYSARIQTVSEEDNKRYYDLIRAFEKRTNCGVIINTSFNVRGEPIVCTPADAYQCFMRTEMDYLVLGNFILDKTKQSELKEEKDWREEFELD